MAVAPCIKDGFLPQSSPPDQGEIRVGEQAAEDFFRSLLEPKREAETQECADRV